MADKVALGAASAAGLLPAGAAGFGTTNIFDFGRVNPVKPIDDPVDEPGDDEDVPGHEEEKEGAPFPPRESHPEVTPPPSIRVGPVDIPIDEGDFDSGDELLPPEVVEVASEGMDENERRGFDEVLGERIRGAREILEGAMDGQPPEIRENEPFSRWILKLILKGVFGQLSIVSIGKIIGDIWEIYTKGPWSTGPRDGVPPKDPPPPDDPFERTVYWSQRPVAPHCKRHIYTDRDGKLSSLLVCSDEHGTRTYHNR